MSRDGPRRATRYSLAVSISLQNSPGEQLHELGKAGARRAKLWLDSTTRVTQSWTVYDDVGVSKLQYSWPEADETYSYDIGGMFYGGDLDGQAFLVECKKYTTDNQGAHFDKFLAQSYVTLRDEPRLADHFIWITWHPFRLKTWNVLYSKEKIVAALKRERLRVFGEIEVDNVEALIDGDVLHDLSSRIWMIVLSDKQENLVISREDRAELMKQRVLKDL